MTTVYHIPVCPFSQRLEIALALKDATDRVDFHVVDITKPRPEWLLDKARGATAMPLLETTEGQILKESLVLLRYLDASIEPAIARDDPYEHAVEHMLITLEADFVRSGYVQVMNQDPSRREALHQATCAQFAKLDAFLRAHGSPKSPFLFDTFGLAEAVYTPFFKRFRFLDYYEGFELPDAGFERVQAWREACEAHPAAQQITTEEIVKVYYDYARGAGNGALPPGRSVSSFVFTPSWRERPWPPRDKWTQHASDAELGLLTRTT